MARLPVPADAKSFVEQERAAYRRRIVERLAPIFASEFFTSEGWENYDDLADSLRRMADAIVERTF